MNPSLRTPLAPALVLLLVLLAGCAPGRRIEAALLLADLAAGGEPSWLKAHTPEPLRSEIGFTVEDRSYTADLYRSPDGVQAPLLLIPGAAEAGKDDPRLVAFATSLARARFAVLIPDLPGLRQQRVEAADARLVIDAMAWLLSDPELAPAGRGGLAAFSYAVGPAVLAALDGSLRSRLQFILAVGGYYDLPEVLAFFTTGWYRHQGQWRYLQPNAYGKWVFVSSNLHRVSDPDDREVLRSMAERKMRDLDAPLEDLEPKLKSEGNAIYRFLVNRDPRRVPLLLQELPPAIRDEMAALNLAARDLSKLEAQLLLLHGYQDSIIPFAQSVALDGALPADQAELYLVDGLMHVDLDPGFADLWRLWGAVAALLEQRDILAGQALPAASTTGSE